MEPIPLTVGTGSIPGAKHSDTAWDWEDSAPDLKELQTSRLREVFLTYTSEILRKRKWVAAADLWKSFQEVSGLGHEGPVDPSPLSK